jgi:cyanate permease
MTQIMNADAAATSHPGATRRWLVAGVLLLVVVAGFFDRISIAVLFTNKDFNDTLGSMAALIIPPAVTASGFGVYNGVGNLIGASSPLLMGWIIGSTGDFNAGLMVLIFSGVVGACAMLPLIRRY